MIKYTIYDDGKDVYSDNLTAQQVIDELNTILHYEMQDSDEQEVSNIKDAIDGFKMIGYKVSKKMGRGGMTKKRKKVRKVMHEFKEGELTSHGRKVKDRKQAIAIALSEAGLSKKEKGGDVSLEEDVAQKLELNRSGVISKEQMIKEGATGSLTKAFERYIPIKKIEGADPINADWTDDEGNVNKFVKGQQIKTLIEVIYDKETDTYKLQNGNHRLTQAELNGQKHIAAYVEPDKDSIGDAKLKNPDLQYIKKTSKEGSFGTGGEVAEIKMYKNDSQSTNSKYYTFVQGNKTIKIRVSDHHSNAILGDSDYEFSAPLTDAQVKKMGEEIISKIQDINNVYEGDIVKSKDGTEYKVEGNISTTRGDRVRVSYLEIKNRVAKDHKGEYIPDSEFFNEASKQKMVKVKSIGYSDLTPKEFTNRFGVKFKRGKNPNEQSIKKTTKTKGSWVESLTYDEKVFCKIVAEKVLNVKQEHCEDYDCLKSIDRDRMKNAIMSMKEQLSNEGLEVANSTINKL